MARRKKVEIFSAGCACCREAEALIRRIAGADHDVEVRDMFHAGTANQALRKGIRSVPAIVVDGTLASPVGGGLDEEMLRLALV